jgi:unsaturated rhamnogalacturonyl hydrolase
LADSKDLPFDVGGRAITEVKRVSLDAGQNVSRFESRYLRRRRAAADQAVGIKRSPGSAVAVNRAEGWMRTWEPFKDAGQLGCAVILDPSFQEAIEADGNYLVVGPVGTDGIAVHYAGFGWDRSGQFAGLADWTAYVASVAARSKAPVKVTVSKE